jgi:hypothetical protein
MCEKPVTLLPSVEKPAVFCPSTSATALAMPYGSVAPANTLPPLSVPMSWSTYLKTSKEDEEVGEGEEVVDEADGPAKSDNASNKLNLETSRIDDMAAAGVLA